jgi:hypothetical protein
MKDRQIRYDLFSAAGVFGLPQMEQGSPAVRASQVAQVLPTSSS